MSAPKLTPTEVPNLPRHEVANLLPMMTPEEQAALTESVRRTGIQTPVLVWYDHAKEKWWLVDGRNRIDAYSRLIEDGVTKTLDGEAIKLPFTQFTGTELEMLGHVLGLNRDRRHLSSSQKAALTVRGRVLEAKYAKRLKTEDPRAGITDDDLVSQMAKEAGTNRAYLYDCMRLQREAPDLLAAVAAGEMKVNVAMAELRTRLARISSPPVEPTAPPAETSGDPAIPATEPEPPPAVIVYDGLKQPVAQEHEQMFASRAVFADLTKRIRAIVKEATELSAAPGGPAIPLEEIIADLQRSATNLRAARPHVVCHDCNGSGLQPNSRRKCPTCDRKGFLTELEYKAHAKSANSEEPTPVAEPEPEPAIA